MTNTQYRSYVECENRIRTTIHLMSMEKFAYRKSEVYRYYRNQLLNSVEFKRQTKREQSTLSAILWFNYKIEMEKITYVPIWKDKVYKYYDDYPQELKDYIFAHYSHRTIYMGIESEALANGDYSVADINKHIEMWLQENPTTPLPWDTVEPTLEDIL